MTISRACDVRTLLLEELTRLIDPTQGAGSPKQDCRRSLNAKQKSSCKKSPNY